MSDASTRALVLRQFAALRRTNISSLDALRRLAGSTPAPAVQAQLTEAMRLLEQPQAVAPTDLFVRTLAHPTGDPELSDALALSMEAALDARNALRTGALLMQAIVAGTLLLFSAVGWAEALIDAPIEVETLPFATQAILGFGRLFRFSGPIIALIWVVLIGRFTPSFGTGARAFDRSRLLYEASTLATPNLGALALNPVEQLYLRALIARQPMQVALRTLAKELQAEGRRSLAIYRVIAPMLCGLFFAWTVSGVLLGLYTPIFTIAGAIK